MQILSKVKKQAGAMNSVNYHYDFYDTAFGKEIFALTLQSAWPQICNMSLQYETQLDTEHFILFNCVGWGWQKIWRNRHRLAIFADLSQLTGVLIQTDYIYLPFDLIQSHW